MLLLVDVRSICGLTMMHATGESGQSQGEDRHETEPLIEPSKKSFMEQGWNTLTSRNLHAAITQSMGTGPFTSKWLQTRYRSLKIVFHNSIHSCNNDAVII